MDVNRKYGFEPIVSSNTEILVIGTLPGGESLRKGQYYADYDNLFWDIIIRVLDENWNNYLLVQEELGYRERCDFLLKKKIGLWDVLASAERESSSDNKIRNPEYNEFASFFENHKKIDKLIFNGKKSYIFFKKEYLSLLHKYEYAILNSTSPQNSTNSFWILKEWKKAIINAT